MEKQIKDFSEIEVRKVVQKHLGCGIFDIIIHKIFKIKRYSVQKKEQETVYLIRYYKGGNQKEITVDTLEIEKSKMLKTI